MNQEKLILCYIPCPNEALAKKIATTLVEEKLAACCNIIPGIKSIYFWDETIQEDSELILIAKTIKTNFAKIEKRVTELHPYDCPCIAALDLVDINDSYREWITRSLRGSVVAWRRR